MNTVTERRAHLPVEEWSAAMAAAVDGICRLGAELVAVHRASSDRAEEVCRNWRLAERQKEEHAVLDDVFSSGRAVLEKLDAVLQAPAPAAMKDAADAIENSLPLLDDAFLHIRHCAQDILHWAGRYAPAGGSSLPEAYRESHARLISYAPVLKPRLEALQAELAERVAGGDVSPEARALLSAITRYNGVLDTVRRFVHAVAEPPLELVFAETDRFLEDMQAIPLEQRRTLGSELNDCCQSLQYDRPSFDARVAPVSLEQPDGVDSSLVAFEHGGFHVLMTVDEDPIFGQLTVHLLRAVDDAGYETACTGVSAVLCNEWR